MKTNVIVANETTDAVVSPQTIEDYAGFGVEDIEPKRSYLSINQADSMPVLTDRMEVGSWRINYPKKNFPRGLEVIPICFKKGYCIRAPAPSYRTIAWYGYREIQPVFKKAVVMGIERNNVPHHPVTGVQMQDSMVYVFLITEDPGIGPVIFNPPLGSFPALKKWNSVLQAETLPNGKPAPIFNSKWILETEFDLTSKKCRVSDVKFSGETSENFFQEYILPIIPAWKTYSPSMTLIEDQGVTDVDVNNAIPVIEDIPF